MPRDEEIARLIIRIQAQTAEMNTAMKNAETRISRFASTAKKLLAGIGAAFVVRGIVRAVRDAADFADEMMKTSQRVGVAVETLSALSHAADLSGISFQNVATSMRIFSRNIYDAASGMGEAKDAFADLGVSVTDSSGRLKNVETLLFEIADLFSKMEDGTLKTAIAVRIFGRSGADLIPLLNQGAAGIRNMMEEARQLGIVIDRQTGKAAEHFNDNLNRLHRAVQGLFLSLNRDLLPVLIKITDALIEFNKQSEGTVSITTAFSYALQKVVHWAIALAGAVEILGKALGGLLAADEALFHLRLGEALEHLKQIGEDVGEVIDKTGRAIEKLYAPIPAGELPTSPIKTLQDIGKSSGKTLKEARDVVGQLTVKARELAIEFVGLTDPFQAARMALSDFIENAKKGAKDVPGLEEAVNNLWIAFLKLEEARKQADKEAAKREADAKAQAEAEERLRAAESGIAWMIEETRNAYRARSISAEEAIKAEIKLNERLLELFYDQLMQIDMLTEPGKWYDLMNAIARVKGEVINLNNLLKEQTGTLSEGLVKGFKEIAEQMNTTFQTGKQLAFDMTGSVKQFFSDTLFDALRNDLDNFTEIWQRFTDSLVRAWTDAMAEMAAKWLLNRLSGLAGGIFGAFGLAQTGGKLAGGIPGRDSVPLLGEPGEWVLRRQAANYYGDRLMDALNRMLIPRDFFRPIGFQAGGAVPSNTVNVGPVNVDNKRMAVDLREGIERVVLDVLRKHI